MSTGRHDVMNLESVRSRFPALSGDWVFFDNAGGSQILDPVLRRMRDYLVTSNVQHGASYEISRRAVERVAEATDGMARWLNASDPSEVVFGPSTTMLLRNLSLGLRRTLREGDEIVVTDVDHEANIGPWMDLAATGIVVKTWAVNRETLDLHPADLEALLTERTRLVCMTHASNILGRVHPVAEIARLVHDRGALLCVDAVAYAPHRALDVLTGGADFYVFSTYKVYGPHYAVLYGRREHLLRIPGMNHFFIGEDQIPYKLQPGNVNYEMAYGMLGLWDYLEELGRAWQWEATPAGGAPAGRALLEAVFDRFARHEEALAARLLDYLAAKTNVRLIGPRQSDRAVRVPTVSFVVEGRASDEVTRAVDRHRIGIRFGDFYARRLIDALGLAERNGVVRVSMVHYNTVEEVDRLIGALEEVL